MGVRGLTTYIAENSSLYLKSYELCDCYLVVDGNNIASHLYKWMSKTDSAFGGDYDEYYATVAEFFSTLKKCHVTPIVLFDGGYESRKLKTILSRAWTRLPILRNFAKGFSSTKFYPLFLKQTFVDVMEDLGISCIQCDSEADVEIATVARALNCPVLSYDSDFYIYDVLYIPFNSVHKDPIRFPNSKNFYVRCSIYDVRHFLNEFKGLDKSLLPIIATLLGNDYNHTSSIFQSFFGHVIMPKNKKKSYTQRKIHGVLHWLKKENLESATELILRHSENKNAAKVLKAIKTSIDDYTNACVSESVVDELASQIEGLSLDKKDFDLTLPPEVVKLYRQCRIQKLILDMITLGIYFTQLQIENVHFESSHLPSLQLIKNLYIILKPYMSYSRPLKIFLTVKNSYSALRLKNESNFLNKVLLGDILKQPQEERLKWLCSIVSVKDEDLKIVDSNWSLFLMALLYWIKKLESLVTAAHVHAMILMSIANQVVQKSVGYYRKHSKFKKSKGSLLEQMGGQPVKVGDGTTFEEMLESVTQLEKLYIHGELIQYRQTSDVAKGKGYDISTVHLFACFQSCLFHIMQINALLNYPLPHLKISDYYSGTLLFNFHLAIKNKFQVEGFGMKLFKGTPNLAKLYKYLYENICKFCAKVEPSGKKSRRKKSRKSRMISYEKMSEEVIVFEEDENEEYSNNENNPFAILQSDFCN